MQLLSKPLVAGWLDATYKVGHIQRLEVSLQTAVIELALPIWCHFHKFMSFKANVAESHICLYVYEKPEEHCSNVVRVRRLTLVYYFRTYLLYV